MASRCLHSELRLESSPHVFNTNYKRADEARRIAATQTSGRAPQNLDEFYVAASTFPAPLILPEDELALDGKYPAQSVRSWVRGEYRNEVTAKRNTIYVVAPPAISDEVECMRAWSRPDIPSTATASRSKKSKKDRKPVPLAHPRIDDVRDYFTAFFYGMSVREMDQPWRFTNWETSDRPQRKDQREAVALETQNSVVRVRTRASLDGCFTRQLNLSDLLDACIESVPADAYAVLLLVEHDMYEDEDDDFCCGRAYGGSRVAVVSTARYHPLLDDWQGVERDHAWPASHCSAYVVDSCKDIDRKQSCAKQPAIAQTSTPNPSALQEAVSAYSALPSLLYAPSRTALEGLWLGRVCKTAAHEVGHCLNMDHCVYYACLMQGTANICEDARQPPYLCPVDLAKYQLASGADILARYQALLAFCHDRSDMHWAAAFAAWLRVRVTELLR
ncbi:uncharacterized protein PV09_08298 [Verruconis gallopava]|uniref:Archaemetzincin-2 n=1 Tax=Verruconis gallopava TaxID=253628 RepID=A0A0D1XD13_9PEZI|nr:uncharacterized protein PV09_08298 [Verruconis gallopava]KIW00116.1 hypothetical protein PV09_08298 [Verruconis gallopava]